MERTSSVADRIRHDCTTNHGIVPPTSQIASSAAGRVPPIPRGHQLQPCLSRILLTIAAVLSLVLVPPVSGIACDKSGYCSLGRVSPFLGPVHTGAGLRAALEARSFKKEVILLVSTVDRMANSLMSIRSLAQLGLEHYINMMLRQDGCVHTVARLPQSACVWYGTSILEKDRMLSLWLARYHVLARAIRIGYNVLLVDNDVIFMHDPYVFLKSPPFANFTVIGQDESMHSGHPDWTWYTNAGVTYVQNAAPDGPTAWLFGSLADRALRLAEDDFAWRMSIGFRRAQVTDQDVYNDLLKSGLTGRLAPAFPELADHDPRMWPKIKDYLDNNIFNRFNVTELTLDAPLAWQEVVGSVNVTVRWHWLQIPNRREGIPPASLGLWPLYPPKMGNLSKEWQRVYMGDCPDCPMWPNPLKKAEADRAATIPREKMGWFPHWMAIAYHERGRRGLWDRRTRDPPQQVLGHVHYPACQCGDGVLAKMMTVCLLGYCDLDLVYHFHPHHLYYSSTPGQPTTKALALSPAIDLTGLRSSLEAWWIFHDLAMVAHALGRAVVWPDLPCNVSYLPLTPEGASSVPLNLRDGFVPHGPLSDLRCSWDMWWLLGCMEAGRGLYTTEWEHLKSKLPQEQREPSPSNTILSLSHQLLPAVRAQAVGIAAKAAAAGESSMSSPVDGVVEVDLKELQEAAAHLDALPVLYLAHPVRIRFPDMATQLNFDLHWSNCSALDRPKMEQQCLSMKYGPAGNASWYQQVVRVRVERKVVQGQPDVMLYPS